MDGKAKTGGIALNIYEVLCELWHGWYTPQNLKKIKIAIFERNLN